MSAVVPIAPPTRLLTVREAAARLSRSEKQLRWMVHQKTAPKSAIIAGRRMFREADIEAYIAAAFGDDAA